METDKELPSSFQDEQKLRGLALLLDALEKIYFRNALRIYPCVAGTLKQPDHLGKNGSRKVTEP